MEKEIKQRVGLLGLIIYTVINFKLLWQFLADPSYVLAVAVNSNGSGLLALFLALFLNIALFLYWLKNN